MINFKKKLLKKKKTKEFYKNIKKYLNLKK